jgi:ribosomal protein S27AE
VIDHRLPRECPRCENDMYIVPHTVYTYQCGVCKLWKHGSLLEVSKSVKLCDTCDGRGILDNGDCDEICRVCEGTGAV